MEKLVLIIEETDGCTYSCQNTHPFFYSSKLEAELDFMKLAIESHRDKKHAFTFLDVNFNSWDFFYTGKYIKPKIYSLDEWFDENKLWTME